MKILLLGRNGQVGWELQRSLAPLGEVVALDRHSADDCGDLSDLDGIAETVRQVRPSVIVNAAAYTAVDKAESEPELAHTVNGLAPGVLAHEAERLGALLVHYSTDYVFAGDGETPWREADPVAPLNVYGRTKLEGERAIAAQTSNNLIFRTSWVYAARGGNFAKTMLRLAGERERLTVIDDQYGAPTGAELIADVTAHAVRQAAENRQLRGIYHLAAGGTTTWNAYARFVIDTALSSGKALKAGTEAVDPVPTSAFPTPARRPHNSRLDTSKLQTDFGLILPPWQQGVARMLREIL